MILIKINGRKSNRLGRLPKTTTFFKQWIQSVLRLFKAKKFCRVRFLKFRFFLQFVLEFEVIFKRVRSVWWTWLPKKYVEFFPVFSTLCPAISSDTNCRENVLTSTDRETYQTLLEMCSNWRTDWKEPTLPNANLFFTSNDFYFGRKILYKI